MTENEISKIVFESGLKIHRKLGIGLYESIYEECLFYELKKAGINVEKQKSLNIQYEELFLENAFRMDLLVENKVVLEIKSVENLTNFHAAQVKNYVRLGNYKLGMLINFNSQLFKNGVMRIANGLD
ncbi:MAG: GxxExxY protein [Chlorobi bacterium]|uniref:GxxExxY protein n=2 Tax=Chryseobacterium TaxID=59732 RepID=A0ABT8U4Q0_9FLAO|nr:MULTISPECIES: GxxExxY protein [unclassified Chryseobacterium]MCF2220622.1 GxxExxY protein [Chryseobacterium sp. PS-8]MDO3424613.1 GxxExxY protein [Chryseobacterium sp. APV1]NPA09679.1 GxxExxY protein [Chlorobiota bacterium]HAO07097.1 GxxExxY protein [Chryseobacterium sp.]